MAGTNDQSVGHDPLSGNPHLAPYWEFIGKKWSIPILYCFENDTTRFSDIKNSLSGLSNTVLSKRLAEFVSMGILTKSVIYTYPMSTEYRITDVGRELFSIFDMFSKWASKFEDKR